MIFPPSLRLPRHRSATGPRWRAWTKRCLGALLPCACVLCGDLSQDVLCADCDSLFDEAAARCRQCALRLPQDGTQRCGRCLAGTPAYATALTLADYAAPLDRLARALKFSARLGVADVFGRRLARAIAHAQAGNTWPRIDLVTPVPLGRKRLLARGYNQSWEIARLIARHLNLPAEPQLLQRRRETAPQTGLSARARAANLRGVFQPGRAPLPIGAAVLLVDDVMTSGATAQAAALSLLRAGAASVHLAVALRTPG